MQTPLATEPWRVMVLGGRGYFGRRVVDLVRQSTDVDVVVGGRSTEPPVDLLAPETLGALDGFDVILNCTDSVGASPVAAAKRVLEHGGVWMDMAADTATVQQLLALPSRDATGHVVVGVGLFPGILTMLGRYVADLVNPCQRVDLGVRLSTLSGAGRGNCRLMVEMLREPGFDIHEGKPRPQPTLGGVTALPYAETGPAASVAITLPDTPLVRRVTMAPAVATHMALVPGWLRPGFTVAQWVIDHSGPLRPLVLWVTHLWLLALRFMLLRGVSTPVQLTAVANAGQPDETTRALSFDDGRDATAMGAVASLLLWRELEPPEPGVHVAAGLFGLDEALVRLAHADLDPPGLVDPTGPPRPPADGPTPLQD
ncbi:MAG: hypothetical protein AAF721_36005 [Myxococcota bacterium]